ncbi:hypothetical protein GUJ93_ZPchr0010g8371 [Zizania palustris]|uniref:[RNA-polymerase]-subunit kinase n=1 Tax=Zizania palustris TaxID=103762 RepID=A0A8J6BNV0_ZIZPA|nr:hypothetical protein GUJ93_ZPchr0010g8371 [Zizania palustris]
MGPFNISTNNLLISNSTPTFRLLFSVPLSPSHPLSRSDLLPSSNSRPRPRPAPASCFSGARRPLHLAPPPSLEARSAFTVVGDSLCLRIVHLEGIVTSSLSHNLYIVFEFIDHDLIGLTAMSGLHFTEQQVKCFMAQILVKLRNCHDRGVLHLDIKDANLLIDGNGVLKITDFGLATFFDVARL